MTLFEKIVQLQIPHSNHCSDLYIPVTPQTTELLKEYKTWADTFTNQVEGGQWYAVAFAYDPYWAERGVYCAEMWQLPQNSTTQGENDGY